MTVIEFDGATYTPSLDQSRLSNQLTRVVGLMVDGEWRTLRGIADAVQAPEASVSARLRDLRKPKFGGWKVERQRATAGLHEYRLLLPDPAEQLSLLEVEQ